MHTCTFLICSIILLFIYLHNLFKGLCSYFDRHGIPYIRPLPLFGNSLDWILMKKPLPMTHYNAYKQLEPHRFGGIFFAWRKQILIRDPELIQNILLKDFSYFQNRGIRSSPPSNILNKQLFLLQDKEWRTLRYKLTSTFTSDNMKTMFTLVRDRGTKLHRVLEDPATKEDILITEICARYTTDVIGSCMFGLEFHSLDNPDSIFRQMGKRAVKVGFLDILRVVVPELNLVCRLFRYKKKLQDFFVNMVKDTVKHREDHNIIREDFLHLLIELKHNTNLSYCNDQAHNDLRGDTKTHIEMTDELMTAQCYLFFVTGFLTSSNTLSFMLMELAQNPHIQDKLRNEIITVLNNNNNELTYEAIKQMKYMDMVIDETLRKHPIVGSLTRRCSEPYKIPDTNYTIPEGTNIVISIRGIHHDSKYYKKPLEFYPEHFTEQAKAQRPRYTFLPFGEGPRICIAERFAKMQIKVAVVNLIKDFSYHMSSKTILPLEYIPSISSIDFKRGIWLKCSRL